MTLEPAAFKLEERSFAIFAESVLAGIQGVGKTLFIIHSCNSPRRNFSRMGAKNKGWKDAYILLDT